MDVFVNGNDLNDFNHECGSRAPAFRSGVGWVDNSKNEVKYFPWEENLDVLQSMAKNTLLMIVV